MLKLLKCTVIIVIIGSVIIISAFDAFAQESFKAKTNIDAYFEACSKSKISLPYETEEAYNKRMKWWKDAKYGMFIHWGLYSILAGEYKGEVTPSLAEWIQNTFKIPLKEYQKLQKQFNPKLFDADKIAQLAKESGMKYVILTSKHHDGFALFDSKVSDYDIMNTPYRKDIVKELKEACHRHGLKFGLYYSHVIDWEHPHAYIGEGKLASRMNTVDFNPEEMDRKKYLNEKAFKQVEELLTNYGTIDVIWYDMGSGLTNDEVRQFVFLTKRLQPNIIISSRIGNTVAKEHLNRDMLFDFYTPSDNYFTGDRLDVPWEMAGTVNGSWGYRKYDEEWRSSAFILNSLISTSSRGGNYLLNVGPTVLGEIQKTPTSNLKKAGEWIKKNKEAIYATNPTSFPWNYSWGYCTEKAHKIFLHVFNRPNIDRIELNGVLTDISKVHLLNSSKGIRFDQEGRYLSIDISSVPKQDFGFVLEVEYKDESLKIDPLIAQNRDHSIRLDRIAGNYLDDKLFTMWKFKVNVPGEYNISIVSNEKGNHAKPQWVGSEQEGCIQIAGEILPIKLIRDSEQVNPSLFFYKSITSNIGSVVLKEAGTYTLYLKGFKIGAGKWEEGLALDRIELNLKK